MTALWCRVIDAQFSWQRAAPSHLPGPWQVPRGPAGRTPLSPSRRSLPPQHRTLPKKRKAPVATIAACSHPRRLRPAVRGSADEEPPPADGAPRTICDALGHCDDPSQDTGMTFDIYL